MHIGDPWCHAQKKLLHRDTSKYTCRYHDTLAMRTICACPPALRTLSLHANKYKGLTAKCCKGHQPMCKAYISDIERSNRACCMLLIPPGAGVAPASLEHPWCLRHTPKAWQPVASLQRGGLCSCGRRYNIPIVVSAALVANAICSPIATL